MHNVKRVKQNANVLTARKESEKVQLAAYLKLEDDILQRKRAKDFSEESLDLTTALLKKNPEYYTVWNFRRHILLNGVFPTLGKEKINDIVSAELSFTADALRQHAKVYWIWNHRRWALEHVPEGPQDDGSKIDHLEWKMSNWARELYVVEKMLDADARNFHAWNYRRYVLASLPALRTPREELKYTERKIEANFSNFSAWHQRSRIFGTIWRQDANKEEDNRARDKEFELVKNALFIDPNDQSGWLYHRWLVGRGSDPSVVKRELLDIEKILELEPDSKWCLESLVHYKQMLLRDRGPLDDIVVAECKGMLEKLSVIDSQRANRYHTLRLQMMQSS